MLEVALGERRARGRSSSAAARLAPRRCSRASAIFASTSLRALARAAGVEDRVVVGRRLRQAGQQRRLAQAQLPDRLREVDLRGGLDADRGAALRPSRRRRCSGTGRGFRPCEWRFGVLDRQLRLDDLAFEVVASGCGMQRLRTSCWVIVEPPSTASPASRSLTAARRIALVVDSAVLVEALVLDRDRRQLQLLRDRARSRPACAPRRRRRARACCRRRRRGPSCRPRRPACRRRARARRRRRRAPRR